MKTTVLLPVALGALLLAGCDPGDEGPKVLEDNVRPADSVAGERQMNPPAPDNGSGLGTASGAGTAPNPTGTAQ